MPRTSIIVFAQVPPPEHGQSRMVLLALETLRRESDAFDVRHVNAKFSNTLGQIGENSFRKMALTMKYLVQAIYERFKAKDPILYYVPGPVKWSAVLRDWILLSVLRIFYPRVVFHWHAIGQGEWAQGSERLALEGPRWLDRLARKISAWALHEPFASIAVSTNSRQDSHAVAALRKLVVCNGIEDPCPDFETQIAPLRHARQQKLASTTHPDFKILFLSHGSAEKGIIDAVECMTRVLERCDPSWCFDITFAGGISESIRTVFDAQTAALLTQWPDRIRINEKGYLTGDDKHRCFIEHDIFLAPSRWESFGLTVIEAMAYGMPIVAAASDGVQGVLPNDHPYLAPVANPSALADKLRQCCSALTQPTNPNEGRPLRARFLEHYQIKDFSENLIQAFQQISNQTEGAFEEDRGSKIVDQRSETETQSGDPESSSQHFSVSDFQLLPPPSSSSPHKERDDNKVVTPHPSSSASILSICGSIPSSSSSSSSSQQSSILNPQSSINPSPISVHSRPFAVESSSEEDRGSKIVDHRSENETQSGDPDSSPAPHAQATSGRATAVTPYRTSDREASPPISISAYLADQNPGHDRSFGISRMSQVILEALQASGRVRIQAITSRTSQQAPVGVGATRMLPWGTRSKWVRLMTDHLHPLFQQSERSPDLHYFPKGYLPLLDIFCTPSVVTIHDTIIQYDEDHYPEWRTRWDYGYWAMMLKHTLRKADKILTVSESSKRQIEAFMDRHRIPAKDITVTYEPCAYERVPQPVNPAKENYVIHLASVEPHKRTAHLIRWWHEAEAQGRPLPMLHLIGTVPPEVAPLLTSSRSIVKRPFLEDRSLQSAYQAARAILLPSEIEGFGLPALEAYYLGTPVCFVKGTSVEEILGIATDKGGFTLDDPNSLFAALDQVMAMSPEEIRACGFKLRETYAAEKVAERMIEVFETVGLGRRAPACPA